jgi:putative component of toxin-antitoxin plasmid stabilization module
LKEAAPQEANISIQLLRKYSMNYSCLRVLLCKIIDNQTTCRAKGAGAIVHMKHGNLSNVKSVGEGVLEYRIDFGPGTRTSAQRFDGLAESIAGSPNVWVW